MSHALVTDGFDLDTSDASFLFDSGHLGRLRLRGSSDDSAKQIFIGIGPTPQVSGYLDGVAYARVTDIDLGPFKATYELNQGTGTPQPPARAPSGSLQSPDPARRCSTGRRRTGTARSSS